ncbi:DoxX family protein [Flavobacterium sp. HJJ]|uniref:DoxX family protein n=1 Tax=Flavobacterium sp. HJJ TaxID=2783792 RepID=UPI00188B0C25|nr:DoxX family protein [Flavobacterium sp. HJJ]MBF4473130.1 DoxX family protein [Flavobacterium sp. HJJ]
MKQEKIIEWFLRISLSAGFLSATADRFGLWNKELSAWGNWEAFAKYTNTLLPFLNYNLASIAGGIATFLEIAFAIALLTNFKSELIAKCSGVLLLFFGLSMVIAVNCKAPLDYSVFTASAGAFALSVLIKKNSQNSIV